jgi:glycosyltransferase involved in cell wall biosynthesis
VIEQRITVVIGALDGGGAQRVCVNLVNAWVAQGRRVTLLTLAPKTATPAYSLDPRVERRDVRWTRAPRFDENTAPIAATLEKAGCPELGGELPLLAAIRTAIVATEPDVVVSHLDLTNVRVLAATHDLGVPVIACEHTDPSRVGLGAWRDARVALYPLAATVVAPHPFCAGWFTRRGIAACAIANALLPPPSRRVEAGRPSSGRRRLITLGRLSPEKKIGTIVRAFARIAGELPQWDLEIYGDGPQRDALACAVSLLSIGSRIAFRGFTDDPYAALAGADLYVSASSVEGFGNSIWEALACGVPVVAMECGVPVATLVRQGVDGCIVDGGEEDLAAALAALMRDDERREQLAARAREAVDRYPLTGALRQWDELLNEVMVPA